MALRIFPFSQQRYRTLKTLRVQSSIWSWPLRLLPPLRSSALHPSTRSTFYAANPMMQKNGSGGAKLRSQAKTLQPVKRPLPPLQSSRFQKRKQLKVHP